MKEFINIYAKERGEVRNTSINCIEKIDKGKWSSCAVSGYGDALECFNDHLYSVSPFFCVESMSCPFCVFDSSLRLPLPESHKLYYNTYSRSPSEVRQYCRNEYSLKLSEKQCRDNRIEPIVHIGILKL